MLTFRAAVLGSLFASALLPRVANAQSSIEDELSRHRLRRVTFAIAGGFQTWSLSSLEDALRVRNTELASEEFAFEDPSYNFTFGYGVEVQVRLNPDWYARAQFDWTRLAIDDRDRRFVQFLGGSVRTPVSMTWKAKVQTHPVVGSFGLGRAWTSTSLRLGVAANALVAPLKIVDEIGVYMESETVSEVESTGIGFGGELTAALDYFTDTNMNLFVELFGRTGSTEVELKDRTWDGNIVPLRRSVDLDGGGIRIGFRWI